MSLAPRALLLLFLAAFPAAAAAAEEPYERVAREFLIAVENAEYKQALALRGSTYFHPLLPAARTLPGGCRVDVPAITVRVVSASDDRADVLGNLPIICARASDAAQRQRLVRVALEKGSWRVVLNRSIERQLGEELLRAPSAQRARVFAEFSGPTRIAIARELLDAADESISEGRVDDAEKIVALLEQSCNQIDEAVLARVAVLTGRLQRYRGNFDIALPALESAIAGCEAIADAACTAQARTELGMVYLRHARIDAAEETLREALRLRESIDDTLGAANVLNGLGHIANRRGRYSEASEHYSRSSKIRMQIGDIIGSARVLNNYGLLYSAKGEAQMALRYLDHAAALFERVGNRRRLAETLLNIGMMYRGQNNPRLGLDIAQRSYQVFCELDDKYNTAIALREMGADHAGLGDWRRAVQYLGWSIDVSDATGFAENRAIALQEMADAFAQAGMHERALRCLFEAYDESRRDMAAHVLARIGGELAATGETELALYYSDRAVRLARELGNPRDLVAARTVAGEANTFLGRFNEAERAYRDAIDATEKLRSNLGGGERLQARFMERKVSAYHGITQLLVSQGKDEEALRYAEQGKSRVLVDVLQGGRARMSKTMTPAQSDEELRKREALAHANLQLAEAVLSDATDEATLARLRGGVETARLAYEQFEARLFLDRPGVKLQRGALEATSREMLTDVLRDPATAIVEYVVTRDSVLAFVVRRDGGGVHVTARTLPMMADALARVTQGFVSAVAEKDLRFASGSHSLYKAVIEPMERDLEGTTHLILIPDGPLWNLPFEALRDGEGKYVIERTAITYAPSVAAYVEMTRARKGRDRNAMRRILAIGNPRMETPAVAVETAQTALRADAFVPLPDSETEVRRIASLYGGDASRIYIGADASEGRLKAEAGAYDVVHLATHAVADPESPMYSYLVLSRERTAMDDGLLEAWEIANLDLRAELVVLSACETARGQYLDGEGIIGLSWAWFLAGAPAAVLSRWKVDSAATAELMVTFHEHLSRSDRGESEALRRAAIATMRDKRYRHPFYWAAFQVIGAGRR